nr:hypothetical protein [Legionella pneumophila]
MKHIALLISCEHAVNTVPYDYQMLFECHKELLESHRGIDFGALEIAQSIHKKKPLQFVSGYLYKALG